MVDISGLIRLKISVLENLFKIEEGTRGEAELYYKGNPAIRASYDARSKVLRLSCSINGEPYQDSIKIEKRKSNLGIEGSYFYFVCPCSGRRCLYLYLYGGRFVSRAAIPTLLYPSQMYQPKSSALIRGLDRLLEVEELFGEKYRKEYYRGKLTPWGKRINRAYDKYKPFERMLFPGSLS